MDEQGKQVVLKQLYKVVRKGDPMGGRLQLGVPRTTEDKGKLVPGDGKPGVLMEVLTEDETVVFEALRLGDRVFTYPQGTEVKNGSLVFG